MKVLRSTQMAGGGNDYLCYRAQSLVEEAMLMASQSQRSNELFGKQIPLWQNLFCAEASMKLYREK